jgi:hypothetical protein
MPLAAQLRTYAGFLSGIPAFVRHPISTEDAKAAVQRRLAQRENAFLRFAETVLFAAPRSPYSRLFQLAGCEQGDLAALVRKQGVDAALLTLRRSGVYVSFEEFKGRAPIVRNGREVPSRPSDFANPFLSQWFVGKTSGSTGIAGSAGITLGHLALQSEHRLLALDAHGLVGASFALWRPILPAGVGLNNVLRGTRIGQPPLKWFVPGGDDGRTAPLKYRLATAAAMAMGRMAGVPLPSPESVPLDDAVRIAVWMANERDRAGRVYLNTTVSGAVRVAIAAQDQKIDLSGATFLVAGEPTTSAKISRIRASGAHCFSDYGMVETGRIAVGCARPASDSDLHLLSDIFAVVAFPRSVAGAARPVNALHVTTFTPESPTLLLNVEFDDEGIVEERSCGCPLEAIGFRTHLREIRSYGRLTGEGVTLVGTEMVRLLEEVLPAQFGGSPLDFQLVEEEDEKGFTRLTLVVNPRITASDDALCGAVFSALSREGGAAEMARNLWQQAGTLRVRRSRPHVSERGKQPSFRSVRTSQAGRP